MKINPVTVMADLPADLAANVESWPHYGTDRLTSENGERGIWRLTGYAEAEPTQDGYRLFVLRMNASTFTYGYMTPGSTRLTVGSVTDPACGTKADVLAWVQEQHDTQLDAAERAGVVAYNVGRPNVWDEHVPGGWGERRVTDLNMEEIVAGVWGLARTRLGRAFSRAWEDQARHDRALAALEDRNRILAAVSA